MHPAPSQGSFAAGADIGPVLSFLPCRTPSSWVELAVSHLDSVLHDHASLELKAAQQAQKLIHRYGAFDSRRSPHLSDGFRSALCNSLSRLAREELRHFEQVVAIIEKRGGCYTAISPSRYAAGLHELARKTEPEALSDALIIGAVIEARSCERFFSLIERSDNGLDGAISKFYASLLRSEARHFEDYLALASSAAGVEISERLADFLERDRELVELPDPEIRFLSGSPVTPVNAADQSG